MLPTNSCWALLELGQELTAVRINPAYSMIASAQGPAPVIEERTNPGQVPDRLSEVVFTQFVHFEVPGFEGSNQRRGVAIDGLDRSDQAEARGIATHRLEKKILRRKVGGNGLDHGTKLGLDLRIGQVSHSAALVEQLLHLVKGGESLTRFLVPLFIFDGQLERIVEDGDSDHLDLGNRRGPLENEQVANRRLVVERNRHDGTVPGNRSADFSVDSADRANFPGTVHGPGHGESAIEIVPGKQGLEEQGHWPPRRRGRPWECIALQN